MSKSITVFILTCLFFCFSPMMAESSFYKQIENRISCSPPLEKHWNKIKKVPEALALISSIQKEGPIQIVINNGRENRFGAYWDPDNRLIAVAYSVDSDEGSIIGSLLFELHNASVNKEFERLDDKETYVRSMEYLEYVNSLNTAKLAEIGIRRGIFPKSARLPTYSNFKEHFSEQKRSGHSACFARIYDGLRSLR